MATVLVLIFKNSLSSIREFIKTLFNNCHQHRQLCLPRLHSTEHPKWFARPWDHFLHSLQSLRECTNTQPTFKQLILNTEWYHKNCQGNAHDALYLGLNQWNKVFTARYKLFLACKEKIVLYLNTKYLAEFEK